MADLGKHGKNAVEELICEAMDVVILEQIASTNHASSLPPDLETRFQLLKSYNPNPKTRDNPPPFKKSVGAKGRSQHKVSKFQEYEKRLERRSRNRSWLESCDVERRGCFWCWPQRNKAWNDESFAKTMRKARKKEEKIRREAERVAKWVKRASLDIGKD